MAKFSFSWVVQSHLLRSLARGPPQHTTSFPTKGMAHTENLGLFSSRCPGLSLMGLPGFRSARVLFKNTGWVPLVNHKLLLTCQLVGSGLLTICFCPHMALRTLILSLRNQEKKHMCKISSRVTHISGCTSEFAAARSHSPISNPDSSPKSLYKLPASSQPCAQLHIPPRLNTQKCTLCLPKSCLSTSTRCNSPFPTRNGILLPATAS